MKPKISQAVGVVGGWVDADADDGAVFDFQAGLVAVDDGDGEAAALAELLSFPQMLRLQLFPQRAKSPRQMEHT